MKTVTIKFGSVDNATSFVKAIEDFESHFDLIYGQYVVDAKSLLGVMTMDIRNKVDLRIMEREMRCQRLWRQSPLISQHNFFFKLYA